MSSGIAAPPPLPIEAPPVAAVSERERFIDGRLHETRRRVKRVDLATGFATLVLGVLAYLFVAALADHWLVSGGLGFWTRLLLWLMLVAAAAAYAIKKLFPPLLHRVNPVYAAVTIEHSQPLMRNSLINFLLLRPRRQEVAATVFQALEHRAAADLSHVRIEVAVDRARLVRLCCAVAAVVAVFSIYQAASPKSPFYSAGRLLWPWSAAAAPTRVTISEVRPGDATVLRGETLAVSAEIAGLAEGEVPELVYTTADGQIVEQAIAMSLPPGDYHHRCTLPPGGGLQQDCTYYIRAGDSRTPDYRVLARTPPAIAVEKIEYRYPDYTGLSPQTIERQGDLRAIEGTEVTIHAEANTDIKPDSAEIDLGCSGRQGLTMDVSGRRAVGRFTIRPNDDDPSKPRFDCYQLRFSDREGKENPRPSRHHIEMIVDLPPDAQIVEPRQPMTPLAENGRLTIRLRAEDPDFGLRRVVLRMESDGRGLMLPPLLEKRKPLPAPSGEFAAQYTFEPARFGLKAGQKVEFWAEAEDNKEPDANRSATARQTIEIVGPEKQDPRQQPGNQQEPRDEKQNQQDKPQNQPQDNQQPDNQPGKDQQDKNGQGQQDKSGQKQQDQNGQGQQDQSNQDRQDQQDKSGQGQQDKSGQGQQNNSGQGQQDKSNQGRQDQQDKSGQGQQDKSGQGQQNNSGQGQQDKSNQGRQGQQDKSGQGRQDQSGKGRQEKSPGADQQDAKGQQGQQGGQQQDGAQQGQQRGAQAGRGEGGQSESGGQPQRIDPDAAPGDAMQEILDDMKRQESGGQKPDAAQDQTGAKENGRPDEQSSQPGGEQTEKQSPASGSKPEERRDAPGQGKETGQPAGSPQPQEEAKPREKKPEATGQAPGEQKDEQAQSPGIDKHQSDSKGDTSGDRRGGGEQGGGQHAEKPGIGSAGQNTPADQGASKSQEPGQGETGTRAGKDAQADKPAGSDAKTTVPAGKGTESRPGEKGTSSGGETKNDQSAAGDHKDQQPTPDKQDQANQKPSESTRADGLTQKPAQPSAAQGKSPAEQDASADKSSAGANAAQGTAAGKSAGEHAPIGGGKAGTPEDGKPTDMADSPVDQANLDYARRQTSLALEHLRDQLAKEKPELLDRLGWTKDEARQFIERWEQMSRAAAQPTPAGREAQRQLDEALRSLGLQPGGTQLRRGGTTAERTEGLRDAGRFAPPPQWAEQFRAYTRGVAGERHGEATEKSPAAEPRKQP